MSLADTIGFCLVVLLAALCFVAIIIEAYWRIRQRINYLKAQTERKKRELAEQSTCLNTSH